MTIDSDQLDRIVLALLFASEEPLSARKLCNIVEEETSPADINTAVNRLTEFLLENIPSIRLERVAGGFQLVTNTEFAEYVARLYSGRRKQRLSKAALETLAIIAYKQPLTRADMENIRGVGCGGVITTLMERSLIRIVGKARVLGAPFLYGTTQEFLEYLGLNSLKDLPSMEELEELLAKEVSGDSDEGEGSGQGERSLEPETSTSASVEPFDMPGSAGSHDDGEAIEVADGENEHQSTAAPETQAPSDTDSTRVKLDDKA